MVPLRLGRTDLNSYLDADCSTICILVYIMQGQSSMAVMLKHNDFKAQLVDDIASLAPSARTSWLSESLSDGMNETEILKPTNQHQSLPS